MTVVALGELLLRLKSPGYERLLQSAVLEATIGGAEANVVEALAADGIPAAFVSVVP
jgi:2-dehydro-3-deoxygluconokinase